MIRTWDSTSIAFRQFVDRHRRPVIMQVLPALNSGGVEQGVIDINAAIVKAGGHSIVVSNGGLRVHEIGKAGGTHIALPVHSKNPLTIAANIRRLRRIIREQQVDVVHACSRAPAWSAQRAVLGTSARYVTSCHAPHPVTGALKRLYNSSIAKGERVIAVSHFVADYLEQNYNIDPQILRVIHRGVAVEKFHPNSVTPQRLIRLAQEMRIPDGASIILLPARLSRAKGHMFLLDAIEKLGRRDLFCLFLGHDSGKGNFRRDLESYIASKDMGAQVRIVPACDDMPAAYMMATVVVSPKLEPEGFGRIPIEAQAMGRPCIATDVGGMRETIIRDETGWLVEPGNVTEFAAALKEALGLDARDRAALATRAMTHVAAHFTNDRMCQSTLDVYAELLDGADAKAPSNDASTDESLRAARVAAE